MKKLDSTEITAKLAAVLCTRTEPHIIFTSMSAGLRPAHARVPAFGWHWGPAAPQRLFRPILRIL